MFGFISKIFTSRAAKLGRAVKESRDVFEKGGALYKKYSGAATREMPSDIQDFLREVDEARAALSDLF